VKALLLTNHLVDYGGSEIQILEVYRFLKSNSIEVQVFANIIGAPITSHFSKNDLLSSLDDVSPADYQLIWSQHALFSRLFKKPLEDFSALIFSVHLSPFEMLELSSLAYMSSIGAYFIANSPETADKLSTFGINRDLINISYNCAPLDFNFPVTKRVSPLKKIAIISNHPPEELKAAARLLQKQYCINLIGYKNPQWVTPKLLDDFDCIISIGKTVQYSLLAGKAIYCYDHFGGPGYLNDENYATAQYKNFSGRGFSKKTAEQIVEEVVSGYNTGIFFVKTLENKDIYRLELFFNSLLTLPPQQLEEKLQQLIRKSYPVEEKIAILYQANKNLNKNFNTKNKKYRKQRDVLLLLIISLFSVVLWVVIR